MKLEHANINVPDIEAATAFLLAAFPKAYVRGEGKRAFSDGIWRHVGTDDSYIALQQENKPSKSNQRTYIDNGVNHLGFEVDDIEALKERLLAKQYQMNNMGVDEEGRTSAYFYDSAGNEWEFVEYHTDQLEVRNNYEKR